MQDAHKDPLPGDRAPATDLGSGTESPTATSEAAPLTPVPSAEAIAPLADPAVLVDATLPHVDETAGALVQSLAAALRQDPGDGQRWLSLCMAIYSGKVIDPADACFRQASLRLPRDGRPQYFLARLAEKAGAPRAALDFYRIALERAPDQAFLHWRAGYAALALDALDAAQASFEAALRQDRSLLPAKVGLGRVALQRGDPQAAVTALEGAVGSDDDETAVLDQLLATSYQRLGRVDEAAALRAKVGSKPPGAEPWTDPWQLQVSSFASGFGAEMQRSAALLETGQVQAAIAGLESLLETYPDRDEVYLRLGTAYGMAGDYPRARVTFRKVITNGSARGYAMEGVARSYVLEAQAAPSANREPLLAEALVAADEAIADPQSPPGAQGLRGDVLQFRGDRKGALAAYRAAAAAEPRRAKWRAAMARMHLLEREWEAAAREAGLAVDLDPGLSDAWAVLAFAAARAGDGPTARAALAKARALAPDDPQVVAAADAVQSMKAAP